MILLKVKLLRMLTIAMIQMQEVTIWILKKSFILILPVLTLLKTQTKIKFQICLQVNNLYKISCTFYKVGLTYRYYSRK